MHFNVNWLAIVVAAIGSFAVGAVWYMSLGQQWMAALGRTREQLGTGPTPFIIGFLCQLVLAYFIALVTPALFGAVDIGTGLLSAAHMWLGFVMTTMILNHRYQGQPWKLTAIDGGYLLLALLAQGLIIGLFGAPAPVPAA